MRIARDHLLKQNTIGSDTRPKASRCLIKNQLKKDGFNILGNIIVKESPQLGGDNWYLVKYVRELAVQDEEEMVEFYIKAQHMLQEIVLQNDQSGQAKRITEKIEELQQIPEYNMALGDISKDMKRYFMKPTRMKRPISYTIDKIYK